MKKIIALLFVITAVFSFAFKAFAQVEDFTKSHGLIYKISGKNNKKPSYIYGTIHIICQNDMVGMDKLNGLINQSEQLLMEIDLDNPTEIQSATTGSTIPGGKTLSDYLTTEQYAKVDEMFKNYLGVSVDNLKSYNPTVLSVIITGSPKALGCQLPASYDLSFMQNAVKNKIAIEGLETAASQFEKLARKPLNLQAKELYEMSLNPKKSIDGFNGMVSMYKSGQFDFSKIIEGSLGGEDFEKGLLDERNIDWIPKIEKAINEKATFIAVGAGHFGGKNGVLNLLKKKGYKLEAIKL
jgi:uncharacterized protein